jgi:hypothetical protein
VLHGCTEVRVTLDPESGEHSDGIGHRFAEAVR